MAGAVSAIADLFRHSDQAPTSTSIVTSAKRAAAKLAPDKKQRNPLTRTHLLRIHAHINRIGWSDARRRDFFALLLAYRGCMRGEEVANLLAERVWVDTCPPEDQEAGHFPQYMIDVPILWIQISSSKTKPQKQRAEEIRSVHTILIGPDSLASLCPITHFYEWRRVRSKSEKSFFHSMRPGGEYTRRHFSEAARDLARAAGIKEHLTGHSARAGCATTAIQKGVDIRLVKQHGRWKSDAVYDYIKDDTGSKLAVSAALGLLGPFSTAPSAYYPEPQEPATPAKPLTPAEKLKATFKALNAQFTSPHSSSAAAAATTSFSSETTERFYS